MYVYGLGAARHNTKEGTMKEEKRKEMRTAGGREGKLWWFK